MKLCAGHAGCFIQPVWEVDRETQSAARHEHRDFPDAYAGNAQVGFRKVALDESLRLATEPFRRRQPPDPGVGIQHNHFADSQASGTGSKGCS